MRRAMLSSIGPFRLGDFDLLSRSLFLLRCRLARGPQSPAPKFGMQQHAHILPIAVSCQYELYDWHGLPRLTQKHLYSTRTVRSP